MNRQEGEANKLERTLDLKAALAIGVGTMVGAGIFVFPGIAAGYAGPAAMLSFALGGIIAMLVAVSTAELATAMPESGGGYYYVSRTFGPLAGFVIGTGQWIGLVFASSFYLTGFGQYAVNLIQELGFKIGDPVILVAFGTALLLLVINLLGTKGVGTFQNRVVVALTAILGLLFGYGLLNAVGFVGQAEWPAPFAPHGTWPIFTTTALIFTSYIGFVQIATVAGEIKDPQQNLPKALVGSVLIAAILYITALFVSTSVMPNDRLAQLAETAMVDVARTLIGNAGALVILTAGLLATLSSANASILSSSRAMYALSNDDLLPAVISRVNERFGTPHLSLLVVGVPIAGLTMFGEIEVLAEVASLLHLLIYGMICVTLLILRHRSPYWYNPDFKISGMPFIPLLGAVASFGLIFFMKPLSMTLGLSVVAVALGWYLAFVPTREFAPPVPSIIQPELITPRILVPVRVSDPEPIPVALLDAFQDLELDVLGYQVVPEQTSPEQSREAFEQKASQQFNNILDRLKERDINFEEDIIFTPDFAKSIEGYIREKNFHSVLTPKPISSVKRLLVPIYSMSQVNPNLATILYDLAESSELPVSLIVMASGESESGPKENLEELKSYAIYQLRRAGLSRDQIRATRTEVANIADAVKQLSQEDDVVILSESSAEDRDRFFTSLHDDIEAAVSCPVLVVLGERDEE